MKDHGLESSPVISRRHNAGMSIILNRQEVLNSLNLEMIRLITGYLKEALTDDECRLILFLRFRWSGILLPEEIWSAWPGAFRTNNIEEVNHFFLEEYALDLMIHNFPKPVISLPTASQWEGALALRRAQTWLSPQKKPHGHAGNEDRVFFPMSAQTGWCLVNVRPGYPEYIGLTSFEMQGVSASVWVFATHSDRSENSMTWYEPSKLPGKKRSSEAERRFTRLWGRSVTILIGTLSQTPDVWPVGGEYFEGNHPAGDHHISSKCRIHLVSLRGNLFGTFSKRSLRRWCLTLKLLLP